MSAYIFFAWAGWCAAHSVLASTRVKNRLVRAGIPAAGYRLFYVAFSISTMILLLSWELATINIPAPKGMWWQAARGLLFSYSGYMFMAGAGVYDLKFFLGVTQLRQGNKNSKGEGLKTGGILARVRHPWYSGGLALIVGLGNTPLDRIDLRILLAAYIVIGCVIEEKRLRREFGPAFKRYQKTVPMLFPRIGRKRKI